LPRQIGAEFVPESFYPAREAAENLPAVYGGRVTIRACEFYKLIVARFLL
jgi:hypothetical protein